MKAHPDERKRPITDRQTGRRALLMKDPFEGFLDTLDERAAYVERFALRLAVVRDLSYGDTHTL
jgi:hypothetical protein